MKRLIHSLLLASLVVSACEGGEGDVLPPPIEEDFTWKNIQVYLSIPDYAGSYEVSAASVTWLQSPPSTLIQGSAFSEDGYSYFEEGGEVLELRMTEVEGEKVQGGPVYDFYQKADYSSVFCELEMDGRAEISEYSQWTGTASDQYYFFGTIILRCFGEEVEMESGVWYDEPGVLVGEAFAIFNQEFPEEP